MPKHLIDTLSQVIDVSAGQEWPDESRIDVIGQNGNSALHYKHITLDELRAKESYHEEQLANTREAMREEINRLNLNKVKG